MDKPKICLTTYLGAIVYIAKKLPLVFHRNNDKDKTVIVLGFSRTGTSVTSGILFNLGFDMGYFPDKSDFLNPRGYFEDYFFRRLNHKILKTANGSWYNPPTKDQIAKIIDKFDQTIKTTIRLRRSDLWGWKELATPFLLESYWPHLTNPHLIICNRNHWETYQSSLKFMRAKKHKATITLDCIEKYYQVVDKFTEKYKVKHITNNFEDLRHDPQKVVDNIIKFLNINVNPQKRQKAIDFIDPSLVHSYDNNKT
ncbi:MAG: hypothetical protein ABH822_00215 [Patescibacteria group bacterium]